MQLRRIATQLVMVMCVVALLSPGSALAAISGKANLVCASVEVVACAQGDCLQGQAHTFDMPNFLLVDVKRKVVQVKDMAEKQVESPVKNFEVTDEAIVMQGFENHRSWSIGIERDTGSMTLSSTGANVSFIVFGNCTEL